MVARLITQNLMVAAGAVETYAQNSDYGIVAGLLIGRFEGNVGEVYFEPSITNHGEMHLAVNGFGTGTLLYFSASLAWNGGRVDNYGLMSAVDATASSIRVMFAPDRVPRVMNAGTIRAEAADEAVGYWSGGGGAILDNVATGTISAKAAERAVAVYMQGGGTLSNSGNLLAEVTGGGNPAVPDAAYAIQLGFGGLFPTSLLINTGLVEAKDSDPSTLLSAAIQLQGEGPVSIHNDGTIRGDYAIRQAADPQSTQHYRVLINNSGLIEGKIALGAGDDVLINRDTIVGNVDLGAGADLYRGESGTVAGSVSGGDGNDILGGGAGGDTLLGGSGDDVIEGAGGADSIDGGAGSDRFVFRFAADSTEAARDRIRSFELGADKIDLRAMRVDSLTLTQQTDPSDGSTYTLITITSAGAVADMKIRVDAILTLADLLLPPTPVAGTAGNDGLAGTGGEDSLLGEAGDDILQGLGGNDRLDGADGDDTLTGGAGDDFLVGGHGNGDVAIFSGNRADYEFDWVGSILIRDLNPADGDDGTDILSFVEFAQFADAVVQLGIDPNNRPQLGQPEMVDQVWLDGVARTYQIPQTSFIDLDDEELVFRAEQANGSPLPSWLSFDPATRTFSGNPPVEAAGQTITIRVFAHDTGYTIHDDFLLTIEQSRGPDIVGTNGPDTLNGTFRDETMVGIDGNDILRGSAGADVMHGEAGTDVVDYSDSPEGVTIDLGTGVGHGGHAEGDALYAIEGARGSAFDDILRGSLGQDRLEGGAGNDLIDGYVESDDMRGGLGDDIYLVDNVFDSVTELPGEGTDEVRTGLSSYVLGANVEKLAGTSASGQTLTGNGLDNVIFGGSGNDLLDGGAGVDVLRGGMGNDVYVIDEIGDNIDELPGWGTDEIRTGLASYSLATLPNFENLRGTSSSGQVLVGNASSNLILGGSGNDLVDGGAGADVLRGGLGNDIYVVDDAGDNIDELPEGGIDEVRTGLAVFSLFALGTFENLTGTSSLGQILEGNGLANVIVAGAGSDLLYGAGGADTLRGGLGNDVYFVDEAGDAVIELTGEGSDEIRTSLSSYSIASVANVENLAGLGNGDQSLTGNGAANVIDGGFGADTMTGGLGNDIYIVDNIGDVVIELSGEGSDEIRTSLASFSLLGLANIENLTAVSNANHDFRGNAGNNVVTGAGGNDFLRLQDGGIDTVIGGGGNDVILFGATLNSADSVDGGTGIDQAVIQGDYSGGLTLGANFVSIESFAILPGSDTRFGDPGTSFYDYNLTTVNANVAAGVTMVVDANRLRVGEDFTFNGSAETDGGFFIYGGGGTDTLLGGSGNDTFYFGENGQFGASDTVNGGAGGIDQLGLRGNYTIVFGANQLTSIESMGLVSAQDTRFGGLGTAYNYNLTMNDGNVAAGVRMTVDAAPLRGAETLTFDGSAESDGSFRIFGGQGGDTIKGSQGSDLITGGTGADNLWGSGGNDSFVYRTAADSTSTARDTIHDFSSGDLINLVQIDAIAGGGNDAFTFIGSAAFTNSAGQLRAVFDAGNNVWTVQGDVNGDGVADIELIVSSDHPLVGGDFIL